MVILVPELKGSLSNYVKFALNRVVKIKMYCRFRYIVWEQKQYVFNRFRKTIAGTPVMCETDLGPVIYAPQYNVGWATPIKLNMSLSSFSLDFIHYYFDGAFSRHGLYIRFLQTWKEASMNYVEILASIKSIIYPLNVHKCKSKIVLTFPYMASRFRKWIDDIQSPICHIEMIMNVRPVGKYIFWLHLWIGTRCRLWR